MPQQQSKDSASLFLSLYLHHHQQPHPTPYTALNQFRQKLENAKEAPHHKPYHSVKRKTRLYQGAFFALTIIFTVLFVIVYTYTRNPYIHLLSMHFALPKAVGCFLSGFCALASLSIGLSIRIEKEAISQLLGRAKQKMRRLLRRQFTRLSANKKMSLLERYQLLNLSRLQYAHALERVSEGREIALVLLQKISECSESQFQVKETLYNEAILELESRLQFIIGKFEIELRGIETGANQEILDKAKLN